MVFDPFFIVLGELNVCMLAGGQIPIVALNNGCFDLTCVCQGCKFFKSSLCQVPPRFPQKLVKSACRHVDVTTCCCREMCFGYFLFCDFLHGCCSLDTLESTPGVCVLRFWCCYLVKDPLTKLIWSIDICHAVFYREFMVMLHDSWKSPFSVFLG